MTNLFKEILKDPKGTEEKLLGPDYPYYKNIKTPSDIGMSDKGSLKVLGKDIDGLIQYVELLVTGKSKASATGKPLGNKFFLQTGAKCVDQATNEEVDRYIYINNVPDGNIPFISSGLGVNFSDFEGLIPGAMGNLSVLNPFNILGAFLSGSTPPCQALTMETIDSNNNKSSETHFITLIDIKKINPCTFPDKTNPNTGVKCKESFSKYDLDNSGEFPFPNDTFDQLYFAGLGIFGIFILYKMMEKSK
jgi:hypothetical protein